MNRTDRIRAWLNQPAKPRKQGWIILSSLLDIVTSHITASKISALQERIEALEKHNAATIPTYRRAK